MCHLKVMIELIVTTNMNPKSQHSYSNNLQIWRQAFGKGRGEEVGDRVLKQMEANEPYIEEKEQIAGSLEAGVGGQLGGGKKYTETEGWR